jgi:hypothetical protein
VGCIVTFRTATGVVVFSVGASVGSGVTGAVSVMIGFAVVTVVATVETVVG